VKRLAFMLLGLLAAGGACAQADRPEKTDKQERAAEKQAADKQEKADQQEKSDKPAEWVVAAGEVNVFAGERFEILVVSLAGEPLRTRSRCA
jgi:hypothetical protein